MEKPAEMDKQPKREIKANHKSQIKFANKRMNFVIKSFMNNFRFLPYSNSEVWNPWLTVAKSEKPYSGLVDELDVGNNKTTLTYKYLAQLTVTFVYLSKFLWKRCHPSLRKKSVLKTG